MKTIGILTPLKSLGLQRMLKALGEAFQVRFEERTFGNDEGIDAWFFQSVDWETRHCIARLNKSCYAVIRDDQRIPCGDSSTIKFSRNPALPSVLSGRLIRTNEIIKLMALPQRENMTVLASKSGTPVWAIQEREGQYYHYVTLAVPELNEGEPLFQYFNGKKFLQLLPLIIFLQTLTEDKRWEQPPLRACFMFDDPNLHWRTYGFVDFAKFAEHAQGHNYHVSFATIPQDTWFFHKPTALLFQRHRDQLSLLIHGNDHIAHELARHSSDEERNRNLRQALKRIGEFERCAKVEVSRVMVPPHGACSEATLRVMAHIGFEAACISTGSLLRYNGRAVWLRTLGMSPSDIIAGLPVFSRFALSEEYQNTILISALLHQPIIIRGHHYDVADGLQLLADISEFVNSLGTVTWCNMKGISRSHCVQKCEGEILRVRMLTKRIEIVVPKGISNILVEWPMSQGVETSAPVWRLAGKDHDLNFHPVDGPIPGIGNQQIEIAAELLPSRLSDTNAVNKIRLWPLVRRQLTETRDRLAPVKRRVTRFFIGIRKN
jgi:hypothetical protein